MKKLLVIPIFLFFIVCFGFIVINCFVLYGMICGEEQYNSVTVTDVTIEDTRYFIKTDQGVFVVSNRKERNLENILSIKKGGNYSFKSVGYRIDFLRIFPLVIDAKPIGHFAEENK